MANGTAVHLNDPFKELGKGYDQIYYRYDVPFHETEYGKASLKAHKEWLES